MGKTITINSRLKWPDVEDDYVMMSDGHVIGRIRRAEASWGWYITIPMAVPDWASGTAGSLEACQRAFGSAWLRFLQVHDVGRIQRALEFGRAAEARLYQQPAAKTAVSQMTVVKPEANLKELEPPRLPPTPVQVFDAEPNVSISKLLPQTSIHNPDMFYFPKPEEEF
jgi:hypothetical protein